MTAISQEVTGAGAIATHRLKDAAAAAALTFFLCFPIVLLHAEADNDGNLYLTWRPWAVLILCAIAFVGRYAILSYAARPRPEVAARRAAKPSATRAFLARYIAAVGVVILFVFPFAVLTFLGAGGALKWIDNYGVQILIYVMLGWGLNIVVGLAGLLDLGYVAFYAVGAYSYALLATTFGLSFWICLPLAGILAALWGIILGFPVLRLRGDYLAIVTLAFGEIIRLILINWVAFSGGYAGIASIPRITFFGLSLRDEPGNFADFFHIDYSPIHGKIFLYYVILCLALLTNFVTLRLRRLPIGRAWEALARRRNRLPVARHQHPQHQAHRLRARRLLRRPRRLVLRGAPGLHQPGELHLHRIGDDPRDRRARRHGFADRRRARRGVPDRRLRIAARTRLDARVDGNSVFGIPDFDPAQYRGLLFGLAMVVMMVFRPRGFVSTRSPSIFLKERKAVSGSLVKEGHG